MFKSKANAYLLYLMLNIAFLALIFAYSEYVSAGSEAIVMEKKALVERLQLTDLCIFTDATYSRNPSMTDLHTPFQDSPMALEHFPSGAIILPPLHLREP